MRKKSVLLTISIALTVCLAACGNKNESVPETAAPTVVSAETAGNTAVTEAPVKTDPSEASDKTAAGTNAANAATETGFRFNGKFSVNMPAEEAFALLGEPTGERDVNNCANGYVNKAYTYGINGGRDYEIYIEQDGEGGPEVVKNITLLSGSVATEEGLSTDSPSAEITAVYPDAVKGLGSYRVTRGNTEIYIKVNGDKIAYIAYGEAQK